MKKIEIIDYTNQGYNFYGVENIDKEIKLGRKFSGFYGRRQEINYKDIRVLSPYILNSNDANQIIELKKEFENYALKNIDINEINKLNKQDPNITEKVLLLYPNEHTFCVGATHYKDVIDKLPNPLNVDDSLDTLQDNEKLFFMDNVKFPRRKLTLLAGDHGKIKNVATVRSPVRATKVIGNKILIREKLKNLIKDYKSDKSHKQTNKLYIKTKCVKDSPNGAYKVGEVHDFILANAWHDAAFMNELLDYNVQYMSEDFLKLAHPNFRKLLLMQINCPDDLNLSGYPRTETYLDTAIRKFTNDKVYLDITSIELMISQGPMNGESDVNKEYIECVNEDLKLVDVSKLYSVIGSEIMDFERFADTDATLKQALAANNTSVIKMMLESMTSYDIDSSIFYLSLIFRNANSAGLKSVHMNTNVTSLYNFCQSKANFLRYNQAQFTSQIIASLSKSGYTMNIPLSFLLTESNMENYIKGMRNDLSSSSLSQVFDISSTFNIGLKEDILPHIVFDLELSDFNNHLNKGKIKEVEGEKVVSK